MENRSNNNEQLFAVIIIGLALVLGYPALQISKSWGAPFFDSLTAWITWAVITGLYIGHFFLYKGISYGVTGLAVLASIATALELKRDAFNALHCNSSSIFNAGCENLPFYLNAWYVVPPLMVGFGFCLWFAWQEFTNRNWY